MGKLVTNVVPAQVAGGALAWQLYASKRYPGDSCVRAPEGAYAARLAPAELREAERVIAALENLLAPGDAGQRVPVEISLIDAVVEENPLPAAQDGTMLSAGTAGEAGAIVRVVQPEKPGERLAWPLVRLLLARRYGPALAAMPLLAEGVAGVIAARLDIGPSVAEATAWVRAELAARRMVSILAPAHPPAGTDAAGSTSRQFFVATSFVAFLIDTYGARALGTFLAAYDPERRDQAALDVYQRTLGALEESWLAGVRRSANPVNLRAFLRHLLPLMRPYWWRQLEVFAYMVFGLVFGLAVPLASKYLIDTVIPHADRHALLVTSLVLLVLFIVNALISMRQAYVTTWINQHLLNGLQERLFAHLQRLPHAFYARSKVGDLLSRLSTDLSAVQQAMSQIAGTGVALVLRAVATGIVLLVLSPLLGVLVIVIVPIFAVVYFLLRARLNAASYESQKLTGENAAAIQENLSAHAVIKAFTLEDRAIAAFHSRRLAMLRATLRLTVISSLFNTSMSLAITLGQLLVLGLGGYLVIIGYLTVGTLLAFFSLLASLFQPVAALSGIGGTMQRASGALARVTELLEEPATVADLPGAAALPPLEQDIRLEHVSFAYGTDRQILRDLDLAIPAGGHLTIVGPSGSGKSTIVNLLSRFWDPDDGRVLFDGHDLREVTLTSLRSQIGIVFQDTFVLDTTVRENIAIGRPGASDAEVAAAAAAARLDTFIVALPAGYDTVLGERGVKMSGGQRQRLAIARALLRDPRILILDEATSALDAATEREILDTLVVLARGRTTISITHRLSLAAMADRVIVLDHGQVVEQGPHAELAVAGGLYQRLYEEQMGYAGATGRVRGGVDVERLRAIPLFANLTGETLSVLADRLVLARYAAGEVVVRQNEPGDTLYIVSQGAVEVVVGEGAHERRLNILKESDYFGEMALLRDQPRVATVRTIVPSEFYSLTRADFTALLERNPEIRRAVLETVARRQAAFAAVAAPVGGGVPIAASPS